MVKLFDWPMFLRALAVVQLIFGTFNLSIGLALGGLILMWWGVAQLVGGTFILFFLLSRREA